MNNESLYWVWLSQRLGAGSSHLRDLINRFESAFEIYRADIETIVGENRNARAFENALTNKNLDGAMNICKSCERLGIDIITYADERYPARLRAIAAPPAVLYCRGNIPNFDKLLCIGIVGTRKMSEYGCRTAYKISYELASAGVVTVSGMASGIDSVVACASFAAQGHTVAVLGSGIDVVYPAAHRKIYNELVAKGTVISEYPPGVAPTRYSFPLRNRIISGLSQGVFVVEGDMRSGAMITARDAVVQGRELFALPGNVGEANANGTNSMIREGAHPVISSSDILEEFLPMYKDVTKPGVLHTVGNASDYDPAVLANYCVLPKFDTNGASATEKKSVAKKDASHALPASEKTIGNEVKAQAPTSQKKSDDGSRAAYASLGDAEKAVYDKLPQDNSAISVDRLASDGGNVGEIIAALTLLELQGLVISLPGGLYARA